MKHKKVLALLCAAVLSAAPLAAGCVGSGNDGNWWKTTGELVKDESGNVVFKNQTVKLTTVVSGEDTGAFNDLIEKFNDIYRNKIKISVDNVTQQEFEQNVATRITQNYNAPDLIMSHQKGHRSYVDNHLVQPFDSELMDEAGIVIDMNEYSTGLAQYASAGYEGKLYSIPCDAQSMAVFYNRDLLHELGYVDASGNDILPANHDELIELCDKFVQTKHTQPITWTTTTEHFYNYVFTSAIVQNGGKLYNEQTKRAEWQSNADNAKAFDKAIRSIRELVYSGTSPTYAPFKTDDAQSQEAFLSQKALFYVYLPWRINSITEACKMEWGVDGEITEHVGATTIANWFALKDEGESEYPADSEKIFVDSHYFAMSRTVEDITKKAAILEFIKWFTQTTSVATQWAKAGHITAYKPIEDDAVYQNDYYFSNYIQKFYPNINNFVCMGNTPYFKDMLSNIQSLGYEAFNSATLNDFTSLIQSKQNELNNAINLIETLG